MNKEKKIITEIILIAISIIFLIYQLIYKDTKEAKIVFLIISSIYSLRTIISSIKNIYLDKNIKNVISKTLILISQVIYLFMVFLIITNSLTGIFPIVFYVLLIILLFLVVKEVLTSFKKILKKEGILLKNIENSLISLITFFGIIVSIILELIVY